MLVTILVEDSLTNEIFPTEEIGTEVDGIVGTSTTGIAAEAEDEKSDSVVLLIGTTTSTASTTSNGADVDGTDPTGAMIGAASPDSPGIGTPAAGVTGGLGICNPGEDANNFGFGKVREPTGTGSGSGGSSLGGPPPGTGIGTGKEPRVEPRPGRPLGGGTPPGVGIGLAGSGNGVGATAPTGRGTDSLLRELGDKFSVAFAAVEGEDGCC